MHLSSRARAWSLAAFALLVCAPGAVVALRPAPQQAAASPDQDQPRPTFRTEANYVRVDVIPTANGQPVTDLREDEFEVLENGAPQRIEQFEHIVIRSAGPQETRIEPNTIEQSRQMLADARARVFVLFLDTYHVEVGGSHNIRPGLVRALDQIIGPDDLVGIMTPEMSAADVTFARRTTTIDGFLTKYWHWGEREQLNPKDPEDDQYYACYPGVGPNHLCSDDDRGVAAEMIERRHEKRTLNALEDLVRFLRGMREERKAILTISDGWRLFRPDPTLARRLYCQTPGQQEIFVDPRTGKPTTMNPADTSPVTRSQCDRDRMALANIDDDYQFRTLLDEANRSNASFYPIDPRGLPAFDTPIAPVNGPSVGTPGPVVPASVDNAMLQGRITSLRTLAEATDGLAMVNSNNLAGGLQRIVNDLTSYYLLGYYSTGKLDGKFHAITVRVKRPGVQVRARRGYLAATEGEVTADRERAAAATVTSPAMSAEARAVDSAVAPLEGFTRDLPVRLHAAAGYTASGVARVWIVGQLGPGEARSDDWRSGGTADLLLIAPGGATVASGRATIAPAASTFTVALALAAAVEPGEYQVRARVKGSGPSAMPSNLSTRVAIVASPESTGGVYFRRGPSTGNREVATADLRFRRAEQLRVERARPDAQPATARLLDRTGKLIPVPVAASARGDADGVHWQAAQLALSPLAPGDYVIEMRDDAGKGGRTLFAFRVVP